MLCRIIDTIKRVCKDYHERINRLEDEKFDLEYIVKRKDMEVVRQTAIEESYFAELTILYSHFFNTYVSYLICEMSRVVSTSDLTTD